MKSKRIAERPERKAWLLAGAALTLGALVLLPAEARGQVVQEPEAEAEPADPAPAEAIIVTGSRITRNGYDAPTPVSVISGEEIASEAPANIADFVNTLPSVSGSQTAVSNSGSLSNGASGISAIDLRSLGENRTLILINGQRSVASTSTGLVDINTVPQALIERVEVVTGGASSVYGSDAVAGVVNFILDTDFTGLLADYEYGVTTYSDVPNHKLQLTAGSPFADDRGHILVSGEFFTQEGKHTIDRDWNDSGFFQIDNPAYTATNGQPRRIVQSGIGSSNFTPGGLITSGPLRGTYFGNIDPSTGRATVNQLAYGEVSGQWMVGGDYEVTSANHRGSNSLANDEERTSIFARANFRFADWLNVFVQGSYSIFDGLSYYQQTPSVGVTIRSDNAFLPASLYDPAGSTSYTIGTSNAGIPAAGGDNAREVERYVAGADGVFDTGPIAWDWDGYYQHGDTSTRETLVNTWQNSRMSAMQDAVYDSSGNVVCRVNVDSNAANDLSGCVPINRIGIGGVTQEALDFLFAIYPERRQYITQDVFGLNFATGALFENWAGPVSLAFGAEYREEAIDGYTDPINYETTWLYGNYKVTSGSFDVKEAYAEVLFPLWEGLEFNGAIRVTEYSTSGRVTTWKAGLAWQPIDDLRIRGTVSRDIRAPNLSELFDPGTARTNSVNVPQADGTVVADEFIQNFTGSLELDPEVGMTYGVGVIFTPTFLPGFALSADYFDIEVSDSIDSITAQQTVNLCYEQNLQDYCDQINFASGTQDIQTIDLTYLNFARQTAVGVDVEASYSRPVGPGQFMLRGLATYTIENISDNGIVAPNDAAGANIPHMVYRVSAGYAFDSGLDIMFVGRGFGDHVYDNDYIECQTDCPESDPTGIRRTINENDIAGTFYLDTNFSYGFELDQTQIEAVFAVKNVFDRDPVLVGNGPDGNNTPAYPQTQRTLYDTLGRVFRLGLRVRY